MERERKGRSVAYIRKRAVCLWEGANGMSKLSYELERGGTCKTRLVPDWVPRGSPWHWHRSCWTRGWNRTPVCGQIKGHQFSTWLHCGLSVQEFKMWWRLSMSLSHNSTGWGGGVQQGMQVYICQGGMLTWCPSELRPNGPWCLTKGQVCWSVLLINREPGHQSGTISTDRNQISLDLFDVFPRYEASIKHI